jgi:beta-galactosidase
MLTGNFTLKAAEDKVEMLVRCEGKTLKADNADLAFVTVCLVDKNGVENRNAEKEIRVTVDDAGDLQGFGNADPQAIGSYDANIWKTFEGEVMAVVKAGTKPGEIKVKFESEGMEPKEISIKVETETGGSV